MAIHFLPNQQMVMEEKGNGKRGGTFLGPYKEVT
jgi:hypothetical protein